MPRAQRTGSHWPRVLQAALLLWGAAAWPLTPSERKTIRKVLTAQVKSLQATEARAPRFLVEERFSNPAKLDVFAFLTLQPREEGAAPETHVFLLSDGGKGYQVAAAARVGDAGRPIEPGFVKVQGQDILLRSAGAEEAAEEERAYSRWHFEDGLLTQVGDAWRLRDGKFEATGPR